MTKKQLEQDVIFLAKRNENTNMVGFIRERDTGMSSNSIVSIAYGVRSLKDQTLPADKSDMDSCENMWKKLPEHRKIGDAVKAMEGARNSDYYGRPFKK